MNRKKQKQAKQKQAKQKAVELTLAPPGMRRRKDEAPSEAFLLKTEPESGPAPGDRGHVKKKPC